MVWLCSAKCTTSAVVLACWRSTGDSLARSPFSIVPQQATVPSAVMPQLCSLPALTAKNLVVGSTPSALAGLVRLSDVPQQATVPPTLMPQLWAAPALIARNRVLASTP